MGVGGVANREESEVAEVCEERRTASDGCPIVAFWT